MSDWTLEMDASQVDVSEIERGRAQVIGGGDEHDAVDSVKSALRFLVESGVFGPGPFHLSVAATDSSVHMSINANMGLPSQQPPIDLNEGAPHV